MVQFSWPTFIVVLAVLSILTIIQIVYLSKTNNNLNNNDIAGAKASFKVVSGIGYYYAAVSLLVSLAVAYDFGKGGHNLEINK